MFIALWFEPFSLTYLYEKTRTKGTNIWFQLAFIQIAEAKHSTSVI